jgi:hypothetical protein
MYDITGLAKYVYYSRWWSECLQSVGENITTGKLLSFICIAQHDLVCATCPNILNVPHTNARTRLDAKFGTGHTFTMTGVKT